MPLDHRYDLLNELASVTSESELGKARARREAATTATQASYEALFNNESPTGLSLATRLHLAEYTAQLHADAVLAEHYRSRRANLLQGAFPPIKLNAALKHVEKITRTPHLATAEDLAALQQEGWQVGEIVTLSEIATFISFQSRVLHGLHLISGTAKFEDGTANAGEWHLHTTTVTGRNAPTEFTQVRQSWEPWLPPRGAEAMKSSEKDLLKKLGILGNVYYDLLAYDTPILEHRTLADRGIMFTSEGLPRAERELAAAVTSKVNGCILCASVHSPLATKYSKRFNDVQRLLEVAPGAPLAAGQDPRWAALITFAAQLAGTPAKVSKGAFDALRQHGLDTLQLLDLVQAVAFFSWANRLMLSLGEPYKEEQ